ncbi:uncharacterized protein LOC121252433 isoform X2 [Juglans microcarpa x Juglans regia]|uniref:uncharacterized protein LOC121252433 isoform X2 n=1 Tax=Juglans microcarpa x Juglans regia TaxID=2249226 RepID=UPI001B7EAAE2|nr:uncharacterized protein LOC121252433 isoform X2 [Juglans microcarpa x Juglans regia]
MFLDRFLVDVTMLPVCSATPSCASYSTISLHGLRPSSPFQKDFEVRCIREERVFLGLPNGTQSRGESFQTQASKSLYSTFVKSTEQSVSPGFTNNQSCQNESDYLECNFSDVWSSSNEMINETVPLGRAEVKYVEDSSTAVAEEGFTNLKEISSQPADIFSGPIEPETISTTDIMASASDTLDAYKDPLFNKKTSIEDFLDGASKSFSTSINKGESALKSSVDAINASISSVIKNATDAVDNAVGGVFSTADQNRELAGNSLTSFSSDLKEAISKASVVAADVLRRTIVTVEDSLKDGASFVVYSYGSTKELLPPDIRDALNLSEERAIDVLRPVRAIFQQVYIALEGLEKNLGLDPNDPIVPFVLFLGTSTTLWVFFWVWTYSGYSGDLSAKLTLEFLTGKENNVLIDVRPEVLRESNGVPDLRRAARSRYANVTLPEVDGSVRKFLKSGRDLDDSLIAAVIRNLKIVQDRSKVIIMDADGTRSKGIARSLKKLGVKQPYLVQGGFESWVKQGLRIKALKPETTLTVLNEGFLAALYALLEWEKTLQIIGIVGLGQTIFRRVASYESSEDFKQDVRHESGFDACQKFLAHKLREGFTTCLVIHELNSELILLLAPIRVGTEAFSWAAGKWETNRIGLPTSPSSSDVQNRVLQAAAKHESQPPDSEGIQDPSPEPTIQVNKNVDLSEA